MLRSCSPAGVVPPLDAIITLTGAEVTEAADILEAGHIVVIHADGWSHFTEGRTEIEAAFASVGRLARLSVLAPGAWLCVWRRPLECAPRVRVLHRGTSSAGF